MINDCNLSRKDVLNSALDTLGIELEIYPFFCTCRANRIESVIRKLKISFDNPLARIMYCFAFHKECFRRLKDNYHILDPKQLIKLNKFVYKVLRCVKKFTCEYIGSEEKTELLITLIDEILIPSTRISQILLNRKVGKLLENIERIRNGQEIIKVTEKVRLTPLERKIKDNKERIERRDKIAQYDRFCGICGSKISIKDSLNIYRCDRCRNSELHESHTDKQKFCSKCGILIERNFNIPKTKWSMVRYCPKCILTKRTKKTDE